MHNKKLSLTLLVVVAIGAINLSFMMMGKILDLTALFNYSNQDIPVFIDNDNTPANNRLTDEIATLGRVLFYDKQLSLNASISCASCHKQEFAFGDTSIVSKGFDGQLTERHAPRLMNMSHNVVDSVFWDHRVGSLEEQPLLTLANSVEMGFSGTNGQPTLDSLINRLNKIDYYRTLFQFAFGDERASKDKVGKALSQFVRSIVSFDSKYDIGRAQVSNDNVDFPNFTDQENFGKSLFISPFPRIVSPFEMNPEPRMFFGCANCHLNPTFSQARGFRGNNGVIGVAGDTTKIDISVVRSPTIRNVMQPNGTENGPFMHDGSLADLRAVLEHYTFVSYNPENTNLSIGMGGTILDFDHRRPMSMEQADALIAFMATLTGTDIYENPKWSDPFDNNGMITIKDMVCDGNPVTTTIDVGHCEGDNSYGYSEEGIYVDTFIGTNGCDSVRTLNLTVYPTFEASLMVQLCPGDSIFGSYKETGDYTLNLQSDQGCDSLIFLSLIINEFPEIFQDTTICSGESYEGYTDPGMYDLIYQSALGCDSIVSLNLDVVQSYADTISIEICEGEEYDGYTTTGQYTNSYIATTGCDSSEVIDLVVLPLTDTACQPSKTSEQYKLAVKIYPNPVVDELVIELEEKGIFSLDIFTIQGQQIKSMSMINIKSIVDLRITFVPNYKRLLRFNVTAV